MSHFFVSYSRHDEVSAKAVIADLEAVGHDVWFDRDLTGGDSWWQEILLRIRGAATFVLVLSEASLRSRPCLAEHDYARALGIPVLPVQVAEVGNLRTSPVAASQVVDYRSDSKAAAMAFVRAAGESARRRGALPEPLPPAPPIPYEYLMRLGRSIDAPHLSAGDQVGILAQLAQGLEVEHDPSVQADLRALLDRLRSRSDVTHHVVGQIDALLATKRRGAQQPRVVTRPAPRAEAAGGGSLVGPSVLLAVGVFGFFAGYLVGISIIYTLAFLTTIGAVVWLIVVAARRGRR